MSVSSLSLLSLIIRISQKFRTCLLLNILPIAHAFSRFAERKEPHDGTHHAALQTTPISYATPSVASVGSSITDVTASPLSAWKAAMASRVIGPRLPSIGPS